MIIDNADKLKHSCMKNGVQCKSLQGFYTKEQWEKWHSNDPYQFPTNLGCSHHWECGRGDCALYKPVDFVKCLIDINEKTDFHDDENNAFYEFAQGNIYQVEEGTFEWRIISDNGWSKEIYNKYKDEWTDERFEVTEGFTIKY